MSKLRHFKNINHGCSRLQYCSSVSSTSQDPHASAVVGDESKFFKWDPATGQFSYGQGQESLLSRALDIVDSQSLSSPDSISVIQRQYSENSCREVGVTYKYLNRRVQAISNIFSNIVNHDAEDEKLVLVYLPISLLCTAVILASTLSKIRYCLIFTGFSRQILYQVLATEMVECIVTSHDQYQEIQTLLSNNNLDPVPAVFLDQAGVELVNNLEDEDVEPVFALYTGGPSSLLAGTGAVTGYYQVTSSVRPVEQSTDDLVTQEMGDCSDTSNIEKKFKLEKEKNTSRLNHIQEMLKR